LYLDGELWFFSDSVIVRGQKGYLKEGGAFWYDSKLDYSGTFIEHIDTKDGTCLEKERLYSALENELISANKMQLCVLR